MDVKKVPWPLATANGAKVRIDTNPDFQRPPVWTTSQKRLLVDTILRGLDVPKLYWQKTSRNPDKYAVIDGQQRLRAIWGYFAGEFALDRDADPVEGHEIAGRRYEELDDELRMRYDTYALDVVVLSEAQDEEVRDLFLRLQNGTPLKAQEKRNARRGGMRDFVKELSAHPFFSSVAFENSRYTYDLVGAQVTKIELAGGPCDVKNSDLNDMYDDEVGFKPDSPRARKVKRVLDYLKRAFPDKTPELERFSVVSLYSLVSGLLEKFVMEGREKELADWFIAFEAERRAEESKAADARNPELVEYHELTSHSTDSGASLSRRQAVLLGRFLTAVPNLIQRDDQRIFSSEQRIAIYRRDKGVCQVRLKCVGVECTWDNWEADHRIPWSKGGRTTVENGQLACLECNRAKGALEVVGPVVVPGQVP